MKVLIFLTNIFLHIVDDFYLQGIMANMKQKKWWQEQTQDPKYKNDYIVVLCLHGFSWAFITHLVYLALFALNSNNRALEQFIIYSVLINACIHAFIDNLKANKFKINLVQDQLLHIIQIGVTFAAYNLIK